MLIAVVQESLRNFVTLVHPFGRVKPAAILIQDRKFGIDEAWLFMHELIDRRAFTWLRARRFVKLSK